MLRGKVCFSQGKWKAENRSAAKVWGGADVSNPMGDEPPQSLTFLALRAQAAGKAPQGAQFHSPGS